MRSTKPADRLERSGNWWVLLWHPNNLRVLIMPQRGILPQPRANSPRLYITQSPSSEGGLQSHTYFLSSSILSTRTSSSETVKFACMKITDVLLSLFLRSSFRGLLIFLLFLTREYRIESSFAILAKKIFNSGCIKVRHLLLILLLLYFCNGWINKILS